MAYNISIDALIAVEASNPVEAYDKVRQLFRDGELTIDDLSLSIDDEWDEE